MAAGDCIELRGLRVLGTHGLLPEERTRAQPFEVDLDIEVDMDRAAATDDMGDTVDYGAVTDMVCRLVSTESCALLESLAQRIAEAVLADTRVGSATVALRKLRPPVGADLHTAGVRITRGRRQPG